MAGSTVTFRFVQTGASDLAEALRGIRTGLRDVEKEQDRTGASATRAQRAQTSAAQRYEQAQEKALQAAQKAGKGIEREFAREEKAAERAANKRIKEAERAGKAEAAAAKRSVAETLRARDAFRSQSVGFTTGLSGGIAKGMIGIGTAAIGASLATVGSAAREDVRIHDAARRIAINSRMAGETGADPYALTRDWHTTAAAVRGVTAENIAEGQAAFVAKTGDLKSAQAHSDTFATVASATGGNYSDIASSSADIMSKFDIKSVEEMQQAWATLTFQGKKGAFELKDAAAYFSEMSAAAQRFGVGSGPQAIKTLGGLAQIARSATGSGAEASTAVQDMFSEILKKASGGKHSLAAHGVDVYDAKGNPREIRELLTDIIGKLGGADIGAKKSELQEIFGQRGVRAVSPLISAYTTAAQGAGGNEANQMAAGMRAVREALDDAIEAPGTWADVVEDSAEAQKSASAQIDAIWEDLKNETSSVVIPALLDLGSHMGGIGEAALPLVDIFMALLDVTKDFVDMLKAQGILKERKASVGELEKRLEMLDQSEEARKKGRSEIWNPSDKDLAKDYQQNMKRTDLVRQILQAKDEGAAANNPWRERMGKEEFAERYKGSITGFGRAYAAITSGGNGDAYLMQQGRDAYDAAMRDPGKAKDAAGSFLWKPIDTIGSRDATELTKRAAEYSEQQQNYGGQAPDQGTRDADAARQVQELAVAAANAKKALEAFSNTSAPKATIFGRGGY
jgi:Phage-related minor tail protein